MRLRGPIPLLKIVSLDALLPEFQVAQLQLYAAQLRDFVAPIAIRSSASDDEAHCRNLDTTRGLSVNSCL